MFISLSISGWACDTVFYLSISVCEYMHKCVWIRRAAGCAALRGNRYRVTSCSDDGFLARSFNPSTDPHRSFSGEGGGTKKSKPLDRTRFRAQPVLRDHQVHVCGRVFFYVTHLVKTRTENNDEEAFLREFCLHRHTCVPFMSDTWAGHFTIDLVHTLQKGVGFSRTETNK